MNRLWNDIWDPTNSYWNEWKNEDAANKEVVDPYFVPLSAEDSVPEWRYVPYHDSVDRLLAEDESAEVPDAAKDHWYEGNEADDDWAALRYFYDVMDFDEDSFEWKLNPEKYEKKYGIKPYIEEETLLNDEINALGERIEGEQRDLDFDQAIQSDLVAEKRLDDEIGALEQQIEDDVAVLDLEQAVEDELVDERVDIEDVVFVDPVTGNIKIDDEAYYKMFGVYPSFEYEPIVKEEEVIY